MADFIGTANDDTLTGGAGNDFLDGQGGDDTLTGGAGNDSIVGGAGADTYVYSSGDGDDLIENIDVADNGAPDRLIFTDLSLADATVRRVASTGDDRETLVIDLSTGDSVTVFGGLSDDSDEFIDSVEFQGDGTILTTNELRQLAIAADETAGNDTIEGYAGDDTLFGGNGADSLSGLNGGDLIYGGAGNDVIDGASGDDVIHGGTGNDTITAGQGADTMVFSSGDGQDVLDITDIFDNGAEDAVVFTDFASTDATITRTAETGGGSDDLLIEFATGDSVTIADGLSGNNDNFLHFAIFNGDGVTLTAQDLRDDVLADSATAGNDTFVGFDIDDTLSGLAGDDSIAAFGGDDILYGGTGNDTLEGDAGADTYFFATGDGDDLIRENDIFDNGAEDRAVFTDRSSTEATLGRVASQGAGSDDVTFSFANGDRLTIENGLQDNSDTEISFVDFLGDGVSFTVTELRLAVLALDSTAGDDVSQGFDTDDTLLGLAGNDLLIGVGGDDTIDGGTGNDTMFGGSGADTYLFDTGDGVDVVQENDIFDNNAVNRLVFTDRASTEVTIDVVSGSGGGSDDVVLSFANGDQVTVINGIATNNDTQIDFVDFTDTSLTTQDLRQAIFDNNSTAGNDTINGFGTDDSINGEAGDDLLIGDSGADTLVGGTGNDTMFGGSGADTYLFATGDGVDVVQENDIFDNGATDRIVFTDRVRADATIGRVASTGNQSDDLTITFANGDSVTMPNALSTSNDTQISEVVFTDETLTTQDLRDIVLAVDQTEGDDESQGFDTDDQMIGLAGDDVLIGIGGADSFFGGTGNDTMIGGSGADTYFFASGDGVDLIENNDNFDNGAVDRLTFTDYALADASFAKAADTGTDSRDLVLTFANGDSVRVNDALSPFNDGFLHFVDFTDVTLNTQEMRDAVIAAQISAGDDTVFGFEDGIADTIEAGTGNDTLNGLNGADTYVYATGDGDDVIVEASNGGTDVLELSGIALGDLIFNRGTTVEGYDDIVVTFAGQAGSVTIVDGLVPGSTRVERISDGTSTLTLDPDALGIPLPAFDAPTPFQTVLLAQDFETDAAGFTDTTRTDGGVNFTTFLGRFAGSGGAEAVSTTVSVPDLHEIVVVEFDFYELDSWDNENFVVFVDGVEVFAETFRNNFNDAGVSGTSGNVTFSIEAVSDGTNNLGLSSSTDQVHHVRLEITDPGETLTVGFGSTTNSGIADESFGIDNVLITSEIVNPLLRGIFTGAVMDTGATNGDGAMVVSYYFAETGDTFTGSSVTPDFDFTGYEEARIGAALDLIAAAVNVEFVEVAALADADLKFVAGGFTPAFAEFTSFLETGTASGPGTGEAASLAVLNVEAIGWDRNATSGDFDGSFFPADGGLEPGGQGFLNILREIGRAMGLDSPHDGDPSDLFPGLVDGDGDGDADDPFLDLGDFDLAQDVYTMMSGINGWTDHPLGADTLDPTLSRAAGPMAIDLAMLQLMYGANAATGAGNDTYSLEDVTGAQPRYEAIWDAGGIDTIAYSGTASARIDLAAASLEVEDGGGGEFSHLATVRGGYSIAEGVVIENATTGSGSDAVFGNAADNTISTGAGIDLVSAGAGNDAIDGGDGTDVLFGGTGNDSIAGGGDADLLFGGDGDDMIYGGDADDTLYGQDGADQLFGGDGTDYASYARATGSIIVNLSAPVANNGEADGDSYDSVEGLIGAAAFSSVLTGDTGDNHLIGGAVGDALSGLGGADLLDGGAGNDTLFGGNDADELNGGDGDDELNGGNADDLIRGGAGNDDIDGGADNDDLKGGAGDDTVAGGAGNDIVNGEAGNDTLAGGAGDDRIFVDSTGDVVVELANQGFDFVYTTVDLTLAENVEGGQVLGTAGRALTGNDGDNWLNGGSGNDTISGAEGNDRIQGRDGDDTIAGGLGNDVLEGGAGNDTFVAESDGGTDLVLDFTLGTDLIDLTAAGVTFADLAISDGGIGALVTYDDTGTVGQMILAGIAAGDLSAADFIEGSASPPPPIVGTGGADTLTGSLVAEELQGLAGNDLLDGRGGADTHVGGLGDDSFVFDNAGDSALEFAGEGYDRVFATVSVTLDAEVEAARLIGSADLTAAGNASDNWITGNDGANAISGGDGADRLEGGLGTDTLDGEDGNDVLQGGADADIFVFDLGDDRDLILDFEIGTDLIDLSSVGIGFDGLQIGDSIFGAVVVYNDADPGAPDLITLRGVTAAELGADSFDFGALPA